MSDNILYNKRNVYESNDFHCSINELYSKTISVKKSFKNNLNYEQYDTRYRKRKPDVNNFSINNINKFSRKNINRSIENYIDNSAVSVSRYNNDKNLNFGTFNNNNSNYKQKTVSQSYSNNDTTYQSPGCKYDQEDLNHFNWYSGQYLTERYIIIGLIGEGTFGRVFECEDLKRNRMVAIKIVRNVARYTSAAKIEAEILRSITIKDKNNISNCAILYNAFLFDNVYMCLVFEKLGPSLYDILHSNCSKGFFLCDIQNIAEQILWALSYLRKIKLTHTDLKLENILFIDSGYIWVNSPRHNGCLIRRPIRTDVKLIDFGSATYDNQYHASIINTRQYRAPEVILDLGWDMSSDMWSFGCILMELYTGNLLFKTHDHLEHLALIEIIIGDIPQNMLKKAYKYSIGRKYVIKNDYYNTHDKEYKVSYPDEITSKSSIIRVNKTKSLLSMIHPKHLEFAKFIKDILQIDPELRLTPDMALKHQFFKEQFIEEI